ncbi:MAG TPA: SdrD B-like domain-containing protein, partial [Fimbriiglobus sp.]|nr:SdrD B-like domain-containing protein [Fimbriiglobus sp.]
MSTHSTKLVDPRTGTDPGHRPSPFRFRYTPRLEWLEDRTVPTTLPGSLFEIDGNLVVDKAGNFDWANAPGLLAKPDAPTGQGDDALGQGAKEDTAVPSVVDGSIPNNKSDLTQFYFAQEAVGGKVFLYLAWERANTLGTANIDFEFNQSVEPSGNGVTPVRTPGDLLISFDFANGGKTVVLGVRKWQASGVWGPATALTSNVAVGAVNDPTAFGVGAITDPLTGQALAEGTFGEAAINLTAADVFPPGECLHFGRAFVKSRSADSFSAELKDFIAPREINIDICSSIGDFVWHDLDGDGVQDASEPGIAGVTLTLTGTTIDNVPVSRTVTTDADGYYLFEELVAGKYTVAIDGGNFLAGGALAGFSSTAALQGGDVARDSSTSPVSVALDYEEDNLTNDFGFYQVAGIGDFVWEDADGDGVQDTGEKGIEGVVVTLTGTTGVGAKVSQSMTTDADGSYLFGDLAPGSYAVSFKAPTGYVFTAKDQGGDDAADSDADSAGATSSVVLTSGQSDLTRDAGLYRPVSIGDFVWVDADGDGVQDAGEAGVAGVVVSLTGTTGAGAKVSQSMTTDTNGSYLFGDLAPGSYAVSFTAPTGYGFTVQDQGSDDAADSDADAVGATEAVVLGSGGSDRTRDAGLYQTVSIGDFVWVDRNGNGVQDTGEPGIGGVQVSLTGTTATGSTVSRMATTDGNGYYLFANLVPGSYAVSFTAPTGYVFTEQDAGGDTTDSDANVNGVTDAVTLTSGQTDLTRDAGLYQLASVGDYVWEDMDGDGIQDGGEAGVAGVGVTLTGTTGTGAGVSRTATTDANGLYQFAGLVPGSYAVSFTAPGYVFTAKDRGSDDAADSDADVNGDTGNITLTSGESDLTRDAGLYRLAVLGDYVWEDTDGDGVQEGGETGIAGAKVTLTGTTGINTPVSREATTDANGYYQFANLVPGSYSVSFTAPAGYVFTAPDLAPDGKDSDADADGDTDAVVLTSGGSDLTRDAGLYKLAGLGDFVWDDLNGNGVRNAGETGIAGVGVTLSGTTGTGASVLTTATTDADGYYQFGNLVPGSYSVSFKAPTGYVFTAKDQGGNDAADSDATATGTTDAVTLTSGQSDLTRDAGLYRPVSIGDFVWDDLNGNGVQDSGESGLQGVTVKLLRAGVELAATTTGPGGAYLFANLVPGTYAVSFTAPAGYVFTAPNVGNDAADSDADANGGTSDVTLKSGDSDLTRDAGLYRPVSLGDFVWEDADGDGVQDASEAGIAGAKVTLTGKSGTGSNVTLDTTTDGNGLYQFVNLVPGTYAVNFEAPTGYEFTAQDQLLDDAADSDADATGATAAVTLKSGDSDPTRDAGLYRPAAVGNFAWLDASAAGTSANSTGILSGPGVGTNVNGIQDIDAGEAGIQGVKVTLHGWTGAGVEVTRTAYTDATGFYQFTDLAPGSYTATFTPLAGQVITARDKGSDDAMDSDADPATGATVPITLVSGQDDTTLDAGVKPIDLSLTKVVVSPQEHYAAGDPITYLITVSNASGFSTATGVQVTDHLPADLVFVSATPSQGSFSVVSGIWDVGTLVGGASAALTVVATPAAPPVLEGVEGSGTLYGSLFEIDGNLTADHGGQLDWANVAYQVQQDIPNRQKDDAFGKGAKEDTAVPVVVDGSIPKNKSDLTRFLFSQEVVSGKVFLYLAWERANTLGTANIDFEFNQSTQVSANGETPVRTPGDLLITFDFASGGNVVELGLRKWLATGEWGQPTALSSGVAIGAVNDKLTFGEAAINLTDTGLFPPDECLHFGSAFVKSRSSDAFTSELKDFIAPMPVNVETCAEVTNRAEVTRADQRDDDSTPGNSLLLLAEDDEAAAGATILLSSGGAMPPAVGGAMLPTEPLTGSGPTDTGLAVDGTTEGHAVTVSGVAPP